MEIWLNRAKKEEKLAFITQARKIIKGYKPGRVIEARGDYYKVEIDGKVHNIFKSKKGFKPGYTVYLKKEKRGFKL